MSVESTCSTCPYCGVGCGVIAERNAEGVKIFGDIQHPANFGRLCIKGSSLSETLQHPHRLLVPTVGDTAVDWKVAIETVAKGFQNALQQHGPQAIGFYVSGQLLTEDYYVANKLMKGFLGSGNIDTNSRLCMSSAVAAHKRAFGEDLVPGCYEDFEQADMIILVGSNMAYTHPVVFQRIVAAKKARPELYVVVIDPRRTATSELADLHLAIAPGTDTVLFNGLLSYLAREQHLDDAFIEQHTEGFEQALAAASSASASLRQVAERCDVGEANVTAFYRGFANTAKVVSVFCQGVNQSGAGTDGANAIINCHLASGKIGKPGATPFSITGQPNAMGGREVGGLANTLAAHMEFDDPANIERIARFWQARAMAQQPGLKAVEMLEAVHAGKIKALWIMATNPAVSMPDADFVRDALKRCEFLVVSDCVADSDTAKLADVLLPACSWGEKTGTVTNSERRISLQRAFLAAPGEAKPDWQIISEVARQMGFTEAFAYQHPAEIFREHAALSGYQNTARRAFNIADKQSLSNHDYMNLQPFLWPANQARLFGDGRFYTDTGRARFIALSSAVSTAPKVEKRPRNDTGFILNSGRIRDQWHTMTRTGTAARLCQHVEEPYVQIHPDDAERLHLSHGALAKVFNRQGQVIARVLVSHDQRRGELFMPIHWSDSWSARARVSTLFPRIVDPISGQPKFKQTQVAISALPTILEANLLLHESLDSEWRPDCEYWSKRTLNRGVEYFLAETALQQSINLVADIQSQFDGVEHWLMLSTQGQQGIGLGGFISDKLVLAFFSAADKAGLPDTSNIELYLGESVAMKERFRLLEGSGETFLGKGPIVCSCHQVGKFQIRAAIEAGATSVAALGENLKCGSNCGSCIPELQKQLAQEVKSASLVQQ